MTSRFVDADRSPRWSRARTEDTVRATFKRAVRSLTVAVRVRGPRGTETGCPANSAVYVKEMRRARAVMWLTDPVRVRDPRGTETGCPANSAVYVKEMRRARAVMWLTDPVRVRGPRGTETG